jgi:CheY-like chemotaxis protein
MRVTFMDNNLIWFLGGVGLCLWAAWLGYRGHKRAQARQKAAKRKLAAAAARSEAQRATAEKAAQEQLQRQAAAQRAARLEARLAAEQAACEKAARLAAEEAERAAAKEAERAAAKEAEGAAAKEAERAAAKEAERAAAKEVERAAAQEAERAAAQEAERAAAKEAERAAAQEAERLEAARLAAEEAERAAALARAEAAAAQSARSARSRTVRRKKPDQTLVMVADDSKIVRIKTGRLLSQHQYRVSYAEDGLDAAQQLQASLPDVVITDVEMPGMDGFELTRRMRQNPLTAHIPVIMITAADDKHREHAHGAGVNVLLGKPYQEEELIHHIRSAMNYGETEAGALA